MGGIVLERHASSVAGPLPSRRSAVPPRQCLWGPTKRGHRWEQNGSTSSGSYLLDEIADLASTDREAPALKPLTDILARHHATLVSQLDAFLAYVAEAEREGPEHYPLYRWTKATVEDAAKRLKHKTAFAVRVSGEEVYDEATADALEAALRPLVGGGLVTRISRHDTNPATNPAVPAEYRS